MADPLVIAKTHTGGELGVLPDIAELGVGEALVSFLDPKGSPTVVERAWILPSASRIGPIASAERASVLAASPLAGHYEQLVDRESAYEKLKARAAEKSAGPASVEPANGRRDPWTQPSQPATSSMPKALNDLLFGITGPRGGRHEGLLGSAARSAARSVGSGLGREIIRGGLGSILGKRR